MRLNKFYLPQLDGLRFIAFLMVFFDHTSPPEVGGLFWILYKLRNSGFLNFGVDLFFVLSSFLITKLLIVEFKTLGKISIKDFLIRRSLRIYPLYYFSLFLCILVFPLFVNDPFSVFKFGTEEYKNMLSNNLLPHLFFYANNTTRYVGSINPYFAHLWTISIEEQFYLVWPFILYFFLKKNSPHKTFLFLIFLIGFVFSMRFYHTVFLLSPHPVVAMGTVTRLDGFIVGALVALKTESKFKKIKIPFQFGFGVLVLSSYFLFPDPFKNITFSNIYLYFILSLGFGIILDYFVINDGSRINQLLGSKLITYLGKISFGLYIFHLPLYTWLPKIFEFFNFKFEDQVSLYLMETGLHFCITLILAMLSYKYLEKPFLKIKHRFTKVFTRPV